MKFYLLYYEFLFTICIYNFISYIYVTFYVFWALKFSNIYYYLSGERERDMQVRNVEARVRGESDLRETKEAGGVGGGGGDA